MLLSRYQEYVRCVEAGMKNNPKNFFEFVDMKKKNVWDTLQVCILLVSLRFFGEVYADSDEGTDIQYQGVGVHSFSRLRMLRGVFWG
jgi:hypothetical protein